jgi:hypothetical protein
MQELTLPLCDFIQVSALSPRDVGWPTPSPFTLRFTSQRLTGARSAAISGSGIYLISMGSEVAYVGSYRPEAGDIVADRWARHLQTITGRGYNIGLGGRDPTARCRTLLAAVDEEPLRQAIQNAYSYSRGERFRDTGYNTTANRLRFASENWEVFGTAQGIEILRPLTFRLFRIRKHQVPRLAAEDVKAIEKAVLRAFKPICNKEYDHVKHAALRPGSSVEAVTGAIRLATRERTDKDVTDLVQLAGGDVVV